jgi:hypothetical protein
MSITATELRQMSRALGARSSSSQLAALANTGVTTPEMLAMAQKLSIPSAYAKLQPESPSACTPICLESIEGAGPNSYVGTDSLGATGVWVIPTAAVGEAPTDGGVYGRQGSTAAWVLLDASQLISAIAAPPGTAAPEGTIVGNLKGQFYTQLDPTGTYIARQFVFNGTPGTSTGWL